MGQTHRHPVSLLQHRAVEVAQIVGEAVAFALVGPGGDLYGHRLLVHGDVLHILLVAEAVLVHGDHPRPYIVDARLHCGLGDRLRLPGLPVGGEEEENRRDQHEEGQGPPGVPARGRGEGRLFLPGLRRRGPQAAHAQKDQDAASQQGQEQDGPGEPVQ